MRPIPVHNPPNPWQSTAREYVGPPPPARLKVFQDATRSILSHNDSPDVGFSWSVNPYRGCSHGCAYCYARPSHQYLGFGAGSDFERNLVVKLAAPALLRQELGRKSWKGERILFSGDTDCYQPLEASYRLTRACLEVCADLDNPVAIVTKGALVERDVDVLRRLVPGDGVRVMVSVPVWDPEVARALEPYAPTPQRRVATIRALKDAGIPVGVNVAPLIPVLGDREMPRVLEEAAAAGAQWAGLVLLRLPGCVQDVFRERLEESLPGTAAHVLSRVRDVRGGKLNDSRFGTRMRGEGEYAQAMRDLFKLSVRRLGLNALEWPQERARGALSTGPRQLSLWPAR